MSSTGPPTIPPRPVRAQQAVAMGASQLPEIPPRPIPKRLDRSISPGFNQPRSPLNEPYMMSKARSNDYIPRPPSVHHLPTPGEEGLEYANLQYQSTQPSSGLASDAVAQTRNVGDLHLHAPKPSLPTSSATAQVQAVTRTDLHQPASPGIVRPPSSDEPVGRTRSRASFSRPDSAASGDRRASIYGDEHGPAELGMRVPINPLLGDVQAPTPSGGLSPQVTGDRAGRRHSRRPSARDDFRPPGSYGLHGHGIVPQDKFERDWYAKHPEQLEHEEGQAHGVYEGIGSGRGSFAMSSDDLNKIVQDTAAHGAGFGTSGNTVSYPDEQIGYMASEQFQKSHDAPTHPDLIKSSNRHSQPNMESPLRRSSFPAEDAPTAEVRRSRLSGSGRQDSNAGSEMETVHIDAPQGHYNKITGGEETMHEAKEARPYVSHPAGSDGVSEYKVPILAEDQSSRDIGSESSHAAVSPKVERRGSGYEDQQRNGDMTPISRPSSRPGSIYGLHSASHSLSRFISHQDEREHMHTPLEDVDEYEPLFPDDDDKRKSLSHAERFKQRPDLLQKRFPSQDIWEDTPSSAMYVAEVSTPDLPAQVKSQDGQQAEKSSTFESPETESARKGEATEADRRQLMPAQERLAKSKFAPHLRDDMPTRPGMTPRFPSQDIWEDSPDSSQLVTTVSSTPAEEETSPIEAKPPVPVRPGKSRLGEGASPAQIEPSVVPDIPARPAKKVHAVPPVDAKLTDLSNTSTRDVSPTELKKVPSIPDRPKPQIPARPAKKPADEGLTKVISAGSSNSAETERTVEKSKPQIPARPAGNKFANLRGNFMNDLNQKLGLGPPKEKEPEPEPEEAKPLEDARKGRARGPQRRAPAKSPSATAPAAAPTMSFAMSTPQSIWHIDEEGSLNVAAAKAKVQMSEEKISQMDHATVADSSLPPTLDTTTKADLADEPPTDAPKAVATGLSTNTAGEPTDPVLGGSDEVSESLTRNTTASTVSGKTVHREEIDPSMDAIPASKQTTASDSAAEDLDRIESRSPQIKAVDEPIKIRNEQVNSAAPSTNISEGLKFSVAGVQPTTNSSVAEDRAAGADHPQEPMNENDVNYKRLEEMTAKADGKLHAPEEGTQ